MDTDDNDDPERSYRRGYTHGAFDVIPALSPSRLLKNSFPPQFDSVLDSVGFCCVHGFDLAQRTFSAAC
jgi:hypothetical protein